MTRAMRRAIVKEARRRGLPVWAFLLSLDFRADDR